MPAYSMPLEHGIRGNAPQFVQLLLQVLLSALAMGKYMLLGLA